MELTETELQLVIEGLRAHLATFEPNTVIYPIMRRDINNLIKKLQESAQDRS